MNTELTLQKILDITYDHLKKQGKKSIDEYGGCSYLTEYGLMCGVGCLIKPEFYSSEFEGASVPNLSEYSGTQRDDGSRLIKALIESGISIESLPLLKDIQRAHDDAPDHDFNAYINDAYMLVAKKHNLSTEKIV